MLASSNPLSARDGYSLAAGSHLRYRAQQYVILGTALYGRRFAALVRSGAVTYG
jgi:hypothetical protein